MKKRLAFAGIALALILHVIHARGIRQETPKPPALPETQSEPFRRSGERSPAWPALAKRYRAEHPTCAACGTRKAVQVHHIIPFHTDPGLELDEGNLISLCKARCHLKIGHGGSYKHYNPSAREDAAFALAYPERYQEAVQQVKAHRQKNQPSPFGVVQ